MKCNNNIFLKSFVSLLVTLHCCIPSGHAKHFGLSSLTYQHLSGNTYHFQFTYYRDCFGITPYHPVILNISSGSCGINQSDTMQNPGYGVPITPVCASALTNCDGGTISGIEKWTFELDVNLPGQCPDWKFSVSYCCRNAYLTNVQAPYMDTYAEARLDNSLQDNSSPIISNEAIIFIQMNQDFHFNNGFTDPDGDSLTFSMLPPMMSANSPLVYNTGFSATQPVSSTPPVSFNSETGDLFMHPTFLENSMMSFLVKEFRQGQFIGSFTRDIGMMVVSYNDSPPVLSGVNGTTQYSAAVFPGTPLCFQIFSDDADPTDSTQVTWNSGIPSATFTTTNAIHPTGTFCWTPTIDDVRSSPYYFTASVRDNNCPISNVEIYSYAITVSLDSSLLWMNAGSITADQLTMYPNPSTDFFTISGIREVMFTRIFTPLGKVILMTEDRTIDLRDFSTGIYFAEIVVRNGSVYRQSIVKK